MEFLFVKKNDAFTKSVFSCAQVLDIPSRVTNLSQIRFENDEHAYVIFVYLQSEQLDAFVKTHNDASHTVLLLDKVTIEQECLLIRKGYRGVIVEGETPHKILDYLQVLSQLDQLVFSGIALSTIALKYLAIKNQQVNPITALTRKESQVVRYIQNGLQNKEIARELSISPTTVKTHVQRILKKTGAKNRTQIIAKTAIN